MQIRYQIVMLKKGRSSVADYFHKFISLVDTLVVVEKIMNSNI
jgi:hypothetical protein